MIQPQKQYFEALFGDRVNYEEMDRSYYPRVRQMLNERHAGRHLPQQALPPLARLG